MDLEINSPAKIGRKRNVLLLIESSDCFLALKLTIMTWIFTYVFAIKKDRNIILFIFAIS